jgi:HD-GYP domain-containing protein (c-di-GMP phosphodiesterase class II)
VDERERLRIEAVIAFADAVTNKRDPFDDGHGRRASKYATDLAYALNMSYEFTELLKYTMRLHDVGKILIAEVILNKPKLAATEKSMIESHSELGSQIIEEMHFNKFVHETILQIHENWDGSGYPNGYLREQILTSARIARIADCFDAMRSKRPYREALTVGFALELMERESGKSFDPTFFNVFKRMISDA